MSTCYRFTDFVNKKKFMDTINGMSYLSVCKDAPGTTKNSFCITDGSCYLWCYVYGEGSDTESVEFCRYGGNYDAIIFLEDIANELQTDLLSEHDEGFFDDDDEEEEE